MKFALLRHSRFREAIRLSVSKLGKSSHSAQFCPVKGGYIINTIPPLVPQNDIFKPFGTIIKDHHQVSANSNSNRYQLTATATGIS